MLMVVMGAAELPVFSFKVILSEQPFKLFVKKNILIHL